MLDHAQDFFVTEFAVRSLPVSGQPVNHYLWQSPIDGTHRVRITKIGDSITYEVDVFYDGGPFTADFSGTLSMSTDLPFLGVSNSHLFFGTDASPSVFHDVRVELITCPKHTGACCDRRIADPALRCLDGIPESQCVIDDPSQMSWTDATACADLDPPCLEHSGACCDGSTGSCVDGVPQSQCPIELTDPENQFRWFKGLTCFDTTGEPICLEHTGACCDGTTGACVDGVFDRDCERNQLSWFKDTPCDAIDDCGCEPETVGGAIYTDCDEPLTSGEENVDVTVVGDDAIFTAVTSGPSGTWHIPDVPCGQYTVTPHQVFREYCHVEPGGDCPTEPCETSTQITVDAIHRAEDLSIQFVGLPDCVQSDMNYDEVCTIVFDADFFVQCVYGGDCVGPDGQDLRCPADCNCDDMATIVFDASCFRHNVYVEGVCGQYPNEVFGATLSRHPGQRTPRGFTVGGAVYDDATNPLVSSVRGVKVDVLGRGRRVVATASTDGPLGIWRVDDLPAGTYTVVFGHRDGRTATGRDMIPIVVNAENEAANLSIRLLRSPSPSRRKRDRVR